VGEEAERAPAPAIGTDPWAWACDRIVDAIPAPTVVLTTDQKGPTRTSRVCADGSRQAAEITDSMIGLDELLVVIMVATLPPDVLSRRHGYTGDVLSLK
jgi:hypothetical protein